MASLLSRRLHRALLSNHKAIPRNLASLSFSTEGDSSGKSAFDIDDFDIPKAKSHGDSAVHGAESDAESASLSASPLSESLGSEETRKFNPRPLEHGIDSGVYRGILVGKVGQAPFQKKLGYGATVTCLTVGTGGIRNNRKPFENEDPKDYANRCQVQWHRVQIYHERLGDLVMKSIVPGSIIYVEGQIETTIFNEPVTGVVRRIRHINLRKNGRLLSLGKGDATSGGTKDVGYF